MVVSMRFSIIIPAHNSAEYIHKALESVKEQTFTDYELIVICDRCDDATAGIAETYRAIVKEVNFGSDGLSRNAGLDIARGDYVMFIDDDDWWLHPRVLEIASATIDQIQGIDCYCYGFIFGAIGYRRPNDNPPDNRLYPNVWSKVWLRSKIGQTRFPNVEYCSDMHFWNEMVGKDLSVVLLNEPIYYYNYLREGSISDKIRLGS